MTRDCNWSNLRWMSHCESSVARSSDTSDSGGSSGTVALVAPNRTVARSPAFTVGWKSQGCA